MFTIPQEETRKVDLPFVDKNMRIMAIPSRTFSVFATTAVTSNRSLQTHYSANHAVLVCDFSGYSCTRDKQRKKSQTRQDKEDGTLALSSLLTLMLKRTALLYTWKGEFTMDWQKHLDREDS